MTVIRQILPEEVKPSMRLGRHVAHDPRSLKWKAPEAPTAQTVEHSFAGIPLDQGDLGSCTGNAAVGLLATDTFRPAAFTPTEALAVQAYGLATHLDRYRGVYPPDDTGSSGLYACKALQRMGYCSAYGHCFGLQHTLRTLTLMPVIVGVPWYSGMDSPDSSGIVHASGSIRGGHEFLLVGLDVTGELVHAVNSWGQSWGQNGTFWIPFADLDKLLKEQGDATTILK